MKKARKSVLSVLLSLCLLIGAFPVNVLAADGVQNAAVTADTEETALPTGEIGNEDRKETETAETSEADAPAQVPAAITESEPEEKAAPDVRTEDNSTYAASSNAKLTAILLGTSAYVSAGSALPLDKDFDSDITEYKLTVYQGISSSLYVKVTAQNASGIEASFVPSDSDVSTAVALTSGASRGTALTNVLKNGINILTIKLTDPEGNPKEYRITIEQKPALSSFGVYTQAMNIAKLSPNFNSSVLEYRVSVPAADTVMTVAAVQRGASADTELTVNGILSDPDVNGGNVAVAMPDTDNFTIPVIAKNHAGGVSTSTTYLLKAAKSYDVTFRPDPAFAAVEVKDTNGSVMTAVNGIYTLPAGAYTYTLTANGYEDYTGSLSVGKGLPTMLKDNMQKGADYSDVSYVENMIANIGGVNLQSSKSKIDAARAAYNALSEADKPEVSNYDVLTEAEHYYNCLLEKAGNVSLESALDWNQFLGNEDQKGVSDAKTPQNGSQLTEKWKIQATGGNTMFGHVSAPAYYQNYIYYTSDDKVRKVDPETGEIVAENDAPGCMMLLPQVTCADGKVFAMVKDGGTRVRVYRASDLEYLYQTVVLTGDQIETPIMYHDGYFYFASYGKGAYYAFIATDEKLNYAISPEWTVSALSNTKQGFLWGGAEFVGDYAYFGDTDGRLYAVNSTTGQIVDTFLLGGGYQVQSTPNYYDRNQRLYVTLSMDGGAILSVKLNADGTFDRTTEKWFKSDVPGSGIKSSPVIYNDRLYVCGGGGHGGSAEPFRVIDANTMTEIYRIDELASKGTPVLSTAYATKENNHKVYLYVVPYSPGGTYPNRVSNMYIIQDSQGQTAPVYEKVENIGVGQYCSQSMTLGNNGLIYYYNDSNYLYAYGMEELADRVITGADVNQQIMRQPEVNEYKYYSDAEIRRIKARYDALSDEQKALVTQYQKLLDILAVSSMDPAERMNKGIEAIPAIGEITLDDRDMITNLYQGYQLMEDADKERVVDYAKLEAAYTQIPVLERKVVIDGIIADIDKLPAEKDILTTDKEAVYALIERVSALGENARDITNLGRLEAAKERVDRVISQRNQVDALIQETFPGVTVTLENRNLVDAVDAAAEGLNKQDLMSLESYEYYVSPAKVSLINALIEKYNLGSDLEVTKDNAETLQAVLDDIAGLYSGVMEGDRRYLENYEAVSAAQAKIDAFKEADKDDEEKPGTDPGNNGGTNGGNNGNIDKKPDGTTKKPGGTTISLSNGKVKTKDEANVMSLLVLMAISGAAILLLRKKKAAE